MPARPKPDQVAAARRLACNLSDYADGHSAEALFDLRLTAWLILKADRAARLSPSPVAEDAA